MALKRGREYQNRPEGGLDEQMRDLQEPSQGGRGPSRVYTPQEIGGPDELARGELAEREQLLSQMAQAKPKPPAGRKPQVIDDGRAEALAETKK